MSDKPVNDGFTDDADAIKNASTIDPDAPFDPNAPQIDPNIADPTQSPTTILPGREPNFVPPQPLPVPVDPNELTAEEIRLKEEAERAELAEREEQAAQDRSDEEQQEDS